jgi:hypothetical protein
LQLDQVGPTRFVADQFSLTAKIDLGSAEFLIATGKLARSPARL